MSDADVRWRKQVMEFEMRDEEGGRYRKSVRRKNI